MNGESLRVGIVGAGSRGDTHASRFGNVGNVEISAVADIDEDVAENLSETYGIGAVYTDYREMLDAEDPDLVGVCVHNNLHAPITIDALEAGAHVFCEKPMAGSYADARAMADAAEANDRHLGVQNGRLFEPGTRAARTLVDEGKLGDPSYARAVYSRRRGRPYVDGYGTPSFVNSTVAGGGPVFDIGTYVIGRMLSLFGNPTVERVSGRTFRYTDDAYDESMVGDEAATYRERMEESGYDVEDAGTGLARLSNGAVLSVRAAWHMFLSDERDALAGSRGGVEFDPFEFRTTMADYEATVSMDIDEYESRHGLMRSESGYETVSGEDQFEHFVRTVRSDADDPIPTGDIALESMLVMEGIYLSNEANRELSAEEIAERSESNALEP
jgi:predicted dehydrogenase